MDEYKSYLNQLNQYFNHRLSSHLLIELGTTPTLLCQYGAPKLPLIIQQSTLTKCTRKKTGSRSAHNLSPTIIQTLPQQIAYPIFLIQDHIRNSIALITDSVDDDKHHILIAIKLMEIRKEAPVNEIKSIYGKTSLKEYLSKHLELKQLYIIDKDKAERLSRVIGLQLPTTLITSSFDTNITL